MDGSYGEQSKNAASFGEEINVLQLYRTFFPDTQNLAEEVVRQIAIAIIVSIMA
jgi:hypothetical protein